MRLLDQFILGVDIGQTADFTALAGLEREPVWDGREEIRHDREGNAERFWFYLDHFYLGYLERLPLQTPYSAIGARTGEILHKASGPKCRKVVAIVDQTGVGRPVVEEMRNNRNFALAPVTITGGQSVSSDDDGWKVSKRLLVSNVAILLQPRAMDPWELLPPNPEEPPKWAKPLRRLTWSKQLPLFEPLNEELRNFKVRLSKANNEQYDTWREGLHDDLVLALCLACWWANRTNTGWLPYPPDPKTGRPMVNPQEETDADRDRAKAIARMRRDDGDR